MNESTQTIAKRGNGFKDITGQRFGKLTALRYSHTHRKMAHWIFLCDCGKECTAIGTYVRIGDTTSCGCARATTKREFGIHAKRVRGYDTWLGMIKRCHNPANKDYFRYGARGITVCDSWREGFMNFFRDMGERPIGKTLERKNNSEGYSKKNCKWATLNEQARNRRSNTMIEINGEIKCLVEWLERLKISKGCYQWRIRHGWDRVKSLTTPSVGVGISA